jgi:hypothetical protein
LIIFDHLKVGGFRLADDGVGHRRPAIGHGLADQDFGVGDARRLLRLRDGGAGQRAGKRQRKRLTAR